MNGPGSRAPWRALLVPGLLLLAALVARGQDKDKTDSKGPGPQEIARLVLQLEDPALKKRQEAMKALEKLGEDALPALRQASQSGEVDVRLRAFVVMRAIKTALAGEELVLRGHQDVMAKPAKGAKGVKGPVGGVISADLNRDGTLLISGGNDRTARLWDLKAGKELRRLIGIKGQVWGVSFSPDGKHVLAGQSTGDLSLHEVATGKLVRSFAKQAKAIRGVQFLPDGKRAMTINYDQFVRVVDVEGARELKQLEGHKSGQLSLAVSRDGKVALSGSNHVEKTARVWDVEGGKLRHSLGEHGERMLGVAISPDAKKGATGCWDHKARLWDLETGKLIRDLANTTKVHAVEFSADGKALAVGNEAGLITLYDVATGKVVRTYEGHTQAVTVFRFSADGRFLVSGSKDNTLRVWRLKK